MYAANLKNPSPPANALIALLNRTKRSRKVTFHEGKHTTKAYEVRMKGSDSHVGDVNEDGTGEFDNSENNTNDAAHKASKILNPEPGHHSNILYEAIQMAKKGGGNRLH